MHKANNKHISIKNIYTKQCKNNCILTLKKISYSIKSIILLLLNTFSCNQYCTNILQCFPNEICYFITTIVKKQEKIYLVSGIIWCVVQKKKKTNN